MASFPKMIYKTREDYKIVSSEEELKACLSEGWLEHWLDLDKRLEEIEKKEKALERKRKRVDG